MTKVSVIVPVGAMRGKLQRLEAWVKSEVTDSVDYVFVVDDYGDGTYDELESILRTTAGVNFTLVRGFFGNPGLARNYGMNYTRAPWITFWDSDDIGHPVQLVKNIEKAEAIGKPIVISGAIIHKDGSNNGIQFLSQPSKDSEIVNLPGMWRFSFRRELISDLRFQAFRMGEDQAFLIEVLQKSNHKYFDPTVVYEYFMNQEGQLTSNPIAIQELGLTLKYLTKWFSQIDKPETIVTFLYLRMCATLFVRKIDRKSSLGQIVRAAIHWPVRTCTFFRVFLSERPK
jgi:glycosyltransferase involved in cell wall biosynthesis